MAKQLLPSELGAIVAGLLINPSIFNELGSTEMQLGFLQDIGQVVSRHCRNLVAQLKNIDVNNTFLSSVYNSPWLCDLEAIMAIVPGITNQESVDGEIIRFDLVNGVAIREDGSTCNTSPSLAMKRFDQHVSERLAAIYAEQIQKGIVIQNERDIQAAWFDNEVPCCDILTARTFIPEDYIICADATVFAERLKRSPSYNLVQAAEVAGREAYQRYLADAFFNKYCS